jgi:hypothetical protein
MITASAGAGPDLAWAKPKPKTGFHALVRFFSSSSAADQRIRKNQAGRLLRLLSGMSDCFSRLLGWSSCATKHADNELERQSAALTRT